MVLFKMFMLNGLKEKLLNRADNREVKGLAWILILLFMGMVAVAVSYFGQPTGGQYFFSGTASDSQATIRSPRTYAVFYNRGVFSPTNLRIHQGDTVAFTNNASLPLWVVSDTVTGENDPYGFNSGKDISPKGVFSHVFLISGIFPYHNQNNPNEIGTIIVR